MKRIYVAVLIIVYIFSSCKEEKKCKINIQQVLNSSVLKIWNEHTERSIQQQNNDKLKFLLKAEKEKGISIFDRSKFFDSDVFKGNWSLNKSFCSLTVVEVVYSGEVNREIKYVLCKDDTKTLVYKYVLSQGLWKMTKEREEKNELIKEQIEKLLINKDHGVFWGNNINEVVAVSVFHEDNSIDVTVLGSLSKRQFGCLEFLN